jgi:acyl transferase domain-containing protein/acyl carrier protein
MSNSEPQEPGKGIAIIGMAGRFPGAKTIEQFWENISNARESITFFSDEELEFSGIPAKVYTQPNYVKARSIIGGIEYFDAAFFGFSPREAELLDPQQRLFLEVAWESLETAGYSSDGSSYRIGVYAGSTLSAYMLNNLATHTAFRGSGTMQALLGNDKDYLSTRVSYKLNLIGPSINVNTACSSSLVAVDLACRSLFENQCDIALAGGVSISVPEKAGYFFYQGGIVSPDGHCRAFDSKAQGTVFGDGVGVVVLKRLSDAIADGDNIDAVIIGSATNNDGSLKVGYTAPSVSGQASVIRQALSIAGVNAASIKYVEAHGTATPLGDPIEIAGLTQAFRGHTEARGFCAVGSVKTNVGHLNTAAGVTGLIKTVLALKHKMIPPSLHFENSNPEIDFATTPFYVVAKLAHWEEGLEPRRAGVSSFGIGGTNAHVIIEEAPAVAPSGPSRPHHLLPLSAKTSSALENLTTNLAGYIKNYRGVNLADVGYTLSRGRKPFAHRRAVVCHDFESAVDTLEAGDSATRYTQVRGTHRDRVVFMFPGQGAQYVNMGAELYDQEPSFRASIDFCAKILLPALSLDLRDALYFDACSKEERWQTLNQTVLSQPALFVTEYSIAKLLINWGVRPDAMIGHSIGEYVAAALAGVFALEDILTLIAFRGQLMQSLPRGAMLAVNLSEVEAQKLLGVYVAIAAVNGPSLSVLSGPTEAIDELEIELNRRHVACRRLPTSHAFHSEMMKPILAGFAERLAGVPLNPPKIPYISNLTGGWIEAKSATDPNYWVEHLRRTVRFDCGLREVLKEPGNILVEVGPGHTLAQLAKNHPCRASEQLVLSTLPDAREKQSEQESMLKVLGQLWVRGAEIDWAKFYEMERRHRVRLPTYPFERERFWVEPIRETANNGKQLNRSQPSRIGNWFYKPVWKEVPILLTESLDGKLRPKCCWLVFSDTSGAGGWLANRLENADQDVITVFAGDCYREISESSYTIDPSYPEHYQSLLTELAARGKVPNAVCHLWNLNLNNTVLAKDKVSRILDLGFYSVQELVRALGNRSLQLGSRIVIITNNMQVVGEQAAFHPEQAVVVGASRVIPREYPRVSCRCIDIGLETSETLNSLQLEHLFDDIISGSADGMVAHRNSRRWVQVFEPFGLDEPHGRGSRLRQGGVYLITGGLGGMGMLIAEYLAKEAQAKLVLTSRSGLPTNCDWNATFDSGDGEQIREQMRRIADLQNYGAETLVLAADVANQQQMERVIAQTFETFGCLNGVIHAAGIADGAIIHRRSKELSEQVLAPKVYGTLVLNRVLQGLELDFFVLCSSLASVVGVPGQVAYCGANAFLDAFAQANAARGGPFTVSINWDAWNRVGMTARPLPDLTAPANSVIVAPAEVRRPLLDECIRNNSDSETHVSKMNVKKHWLLDQHRLSGKPLLPGTAYLEMAREAFTKDATAAGVEIRDVYFQMPLFVADDEQREVHILLNNKAGGFEFSVKSQAGESIDEWQVHASGKIGPRNTVPVSNIDVDAIKAACDGQELDMALGRKAMASHRIKFGPRWDTVKQVFLGKDQALASIELPQEFLPDLDSFPLHPAMLDVATGFLVLLGATPSGGDFAPFFYKALKINGPLPAKILSHVRFWGGQNSQRETLKFNVTIADEQGQVLVEVEDYMLRKVERAGAPVSEPLQGQEDASKPGAKNVSLAISSRGILDTLGFHSTERRAPGPDEVEIEVHATGLNFRDLLLALGVLPDPEARGPALGYECAGTIVRVGDGVENFCVGDEVLGFGAGCFSRFLNTSASLLARKPPLMSFQESATIPVAFATAYYTLMKLGRLRAGERILIHAAAGGVGLAAVKIAQWVKAEIFATAGNEEKRMFLRSIGIQHVFDSRSLAFADEVMKLTGNRGVDVILNSLGGEFLLKSVSVLAPSGRFLEIGLRDILLNRQLPLRLFEKGLSFSSFFLGPHLKDLPSVWQELLQHFEERSLTPLPYKVFEASQVVQAFKYMADAKHIGKIVICYENGGLELSAAGSCDQTSQQDRFHRSAPSTAAGVQNAIQVRPAWVKESVGKVTTASTLYNQGLSAEDGIASFRRILDGTEPQVIVSSQDLSLGFANSFQDWEYGNGLKQSGSAGVRHPRPALNYAYVPPGGTVEQQVAEIWQELLGIERVGIHDNFFDLGGHSLLAIQVLARLNQSFELDLSVDSVFDKTTVAELAKHIGALHAATKLEQSSPPFLEHGER